MCYSIGMEASVCTSCGKPKVASSCGICGCALCKKCTQVLPKDSFSFLESVPGELTHKNYCGACYDEKVAPPLESYRETMERAKGVFVFHKHHSEQTRLMRRSEKPILVTACTDRAETLMRLAFVAAKTGFNALIDVDITATKVRNEGYQTSNWQGTGIPTRVDAEKLEREHKRSR